MTHIKRQKYFVRKNLKITNTTLQYAALDISAQSHHVTSSLWFFYPNKVFSTFYMCHLACPGDARLSCLLFVVLLLRMSVIAIQSIDFKVADKPDKACNAGVPLLCFTKGFEIQLAVYITASTEHCHDMVDILEKQQWTDNYYYYNMRIVHIGTTKKKKGEKNLTKE